MTPPARSSIRTAPWASPPRMPQIIDPSIPVVTLATAHPAKFRDAVERATGVRPALPSRTGDLFGREERYVTLPGNLRGDHRLRRRARDAAGGLTMFLAPCKGRGHGLSPRRWAKSEKRPEPFFKVR